MLGGVKREGEWGVLLLDAVTTQVVSSVAGVADVLDYGISLVENAAAARAPAPALAGVYFIAPTDASVAALLADFPAKKPPAFRAAHVFFSSPAAARHLAAIKAAPRLLERLQTLKEVNLEYVLTPDARSFTTAQPGALAALFGASVDSSEEYRAEVGAMATRLASLFATLKECPSIRYRAALPPGEEYPAGLDSRLLVAQRLAVELHERLAELQRAGAVPTQETCELVITDRGFDPVAPAIHEWTYEAMTQDLLEGDPALRGKVFSYESMTGGGKVERKDHVLDCRDAFHAELRHRHLAAASVRVSTALDELRRKSRVPGSNAGVAEMDFRAMSRLVQALPQYREQMAALAAHVELASRLNRLVEQHALAELGKLEQDLVYGDATSKEVIAFLAAHQMLPPEDKARLLLCYAATHQEKLDPARQAQWQKVARLTAADMAAIVNLEYLGVPVCKRARGGGALGALSFGRRRRRAVRKDREPDEADAEYALTRFVPLLAEVVEDAVSGRLSQDEYPYVRPPGSPSASGGSFGGGGGGYSGFSAGGGGASSAPSSADATPRAGVASYRTMGRAGGGASWARKAAAAPAAAAAETPTRRAGGGEAPAALRGSRVFAFVIGGFTYSELRTAHRLTARLGRDVFLGGTSVLTPKAYLRSLLSLTAERQVGALEVEAPPPRGAAASARRR
jgi:syntaxin-binding protein 1